MQGVCAEDSAAKYEISREAQDTYAVQSYARSTQAAEAGKLGLEIVPVSVPLGRGKTAVVDTDEEWKNLKADRVASLKTVFKPENGQRLQSRPCYLQTSEPQWCCAVLAPVVSPRGNLSVMPCHPANGDPVTPAGSLLLAPHLALS